MTSIQRVPRRLFALLTLLLLALPGLQAQSNYGAIRGAVTDAQGAALEKAQVTLTSETTKLSRATVSNGSGEYLFGAVDPGTYTVTVEISGFQKLERKGVVVDSGNTIPLDLSLTIGSEAQVVEVNAAEPLINAGTSYNGQLIDSQKLQNLPNPGRNPFLFSKLDNNVTPVGDPRFVRFQDQSGSSTISIAGAPLSSNNYSIDGVPITDFSNRAVIIPSIEAVDEVKVQANTYDGEIGRTSGGMFNTTLHSGSSTLHGVLQGETRQTNWGANLFFNNRSPYRDPVTGVTNPTTPRGAAEFYSYVGAIGGPIPLPQKLGGKDKTFFWVTEEGYRQRSPLTSGNAYVVPTALQRGTSMANAGNFSEIGTVTGGACVSGICIKNPQTGAYFENNTITPGLINTVGYNILSSYPAANTSVTAYGKPNFFGTDTLGDRADEFVGKVDHQFGTRLASEFYYMHYGSKEPGGNSLDNFAGTYGSYLLYRKVDAIGIQNTYTLNPTTVITAGFGFNRFPNNTLDISNGFNQATLGFPANYLSALSKTGFPQIVGDSGLSSESSSNSGPAVYFSRNFVTGVSKSLGKHSLKAGYVFRAISLTFTSLSSTDGSFSFDSTLSGATAADVLLGYPTTGSLIIPAKLAITTRYNAIYMQDDWRIMPKLTLNLGIRYEHEPGINERSNHYSVGFDRAATYVAGTNAAGVLVSATGGVEFAGQSGHPTSTGNTINKYSPRIGFAYSIDPKTVIRGGFGLFYQPLVYSNSASYAPGYVVTNSIPTQTPGPSLTSLSNPFPNLITTATGNTAGLLTSIGSTLTVVDQNRKAPFYESYSADLQRDLPYGIALKIGYVGGHSRNQPDALNINQLGDNNYSLGAALNAPTTNPYAGLGFWSNGTQSYNQTIRPFPQFQGITDSESVGYSNYNALDIKVQKSMSQGLTVLAAFTWSSNWDNLWGASDTLNPGNNGPQDIYNLKPEYSRAINDIPKRTTFAVTYELPFGHGKTFLGGANRWVDAAVGGWRFNNIMIIQDGAPLPITQVSSITVTTTTASGTTKTTQSTSNSAYGNSTLRPTLVPGVSACFSGSPEGRLGGSGATPYFNPAAFTPTLSRSYGNVPRTVGCYGPGYLNTDLSLNKNFKLTERVNAEFRAEALNAFNTPEFNGPNLSVGSGSVGQITGTLGFPRLIQLGGRLTF